MNEGGFIRSCGRSIARSEADVPADLALIGAGAWGRNLARVFHKLGALRAICDTNSATLSTYEFAVGRTTNFAEILENREILSVAIAAPAAQHYTLAKAALDAGKDVFVEKPLCLDLREAGELAVLARSKGRVLMVGHLLQYHPCILKLQELVRRDVLGELQYLTSNRLNNGKVRKEENALWSFAPHDISVILSLVGRMPEQVISSGQAYLASGVADTTLTQLQFSGKVRAHVYVSWLNPFKEQKLTVIGSKAMAVFDDTLPWGKKLSVTLKSGDAAPKPIEVAEREPLEEECAHFLECTKTRQIPRTDAAEAIRVLTVLRAAQDCLDQKGGPPMDYTAHPSAVIDPGAKIGKGTKIWHFSHVMPDAEIGDGCNLGQNVLVSHGVRLGRNVKVQNNVSLYTGVTCEDDVFIGPSVVFTNVTIPRSAHPKRDQYEKTIVRKGATIGANATILCGIELGESCFIGAGAVVTKHVPPFALVVGNPAKQVGWVCRHGDRLDLPLTGTGVANCTRSGSKYELKDGAVRRVGR
jgi:UDP-2-acetamido-3-amino-2,3-dideoxy-glucuronate N-acetyltransferase